MTGSRGADLPPAAGPGPAAVALLLESDGPGGAERMLLLLADELRRRGREVVPVGPARGSGWLAGEFRARGFEPETFTLRFPLDPLCAVGLARALRRRGVGVVHSHEFTMAVYGAVASRWLGLPHIITMHGGTRWADRARRRVALRWACRAGGTAVAVSRAGARALEGGLGLAAGTVAVIPNGVRPSSGTRGRVRQELGLDDPTLLILALGNLYAVKGYDVLLRALAGLPVPPPAPWRVAIAGRGEEEAPLRALGESLGLSDRVAFLGFRSDVGDLLAAADLFVMPSRSESHPLALLEAMFAGLPIVASSVGGIPDTTRPGEDALLVPAGDPLALTAALRDLLADPARRARLGVSAVEWARDRFTVEGMADAYERLYHGQTALPPGRPTEGPACA